MSLRYTPDPGALLTALAGRLDALEETSARNTRDLTALGRGLADLTGQIRATLTTPSTPGTPGGADPTAGPSVGPGAEPVDHGGEEGQPDWLAVGLDVEAARELLRVVLEWVRQIGVHHQISLPIACWPLHPDVVADVLALAAERQAAYTGANPTGVSEWLTRWAPAARDRITAGLAECVADRGHRHGGRLYDLTGFDPLSAAAWWTTDRTTPAVRAFALAPL